MDSIVPASKLQANSSVLDRALALAAQGLPVFPCYALEQGVKGQPGYRSAKSPRTRNGFHDASTDPAVIRAMPWAGDTLIGVPTGSREAGGCGLDVLDVDGDKDVTDWWANNELMLPRTLEQATRRVGGRHVMFRAMPGVGCSTDSPAKGIDVRAEGGYVIWWAAEGIPALSNAEPAEWPEWLIPELTRTVKRAPVDLSDPVVRAEKSPPSAAAVVELLNRMHNGPEVGRLAAYIPVMMAAADCANLTGDPDGLIRDAATAWAEKYSGDYATEDAKWGGDWSTRQVMGGWPALQAQARTLAPGYEEEWTAERARKAAEEFSAAPLPEPEIAEALARAAAPRKLFGAPFVLRDAATIEPREWIYGSHYIRKFVSATVAPGGLGKSSLALVEALDMATGRGLLTGKPTHKRYRVIYWNGEDPIEETERRLVAACKHYGLTDADLGGRLTIASGRDAAIRVATDTRDGFAIAEPLVGQLIAELRENAVDVLMLDPFVKTHAVNENDNNRIDAVASTFARIADETNVSIELVHHLRKASTPGQDRSAEDARGGVALISAARSVRVLNVMQTAEAESLGLPDETRRRCFRIDDGKVNLVAPRGTGDHATWRYLESVSLDNARPERGLSADSIGVVRPWVKPAIGDNVTAEHVADIARRLEAGEPNRRAVQAKDRWAGVTVAASLAIDLDEQGARKRVGKIIDALVAQGKLVGGFERDEKSNMRPIIQAVPQFPTTLLGGTGDNWGTAPETQPSPPIPTYGYRGVGCGGDDKAMASPVHTVDALANRSAQELAKLIAKPAEATP